VQQTSGGLLAWREADNWTAFTDGAQTWINGPQVLAQRPNTTRVPWEGDGVMMQGNRFAPAERAVAAGGALTWVDLDRVSAVMAPPDQLNVTAPSGGRARTGTRRRVTGPKGLHFAQAGTPCGASKRTGQETEAVIEHAKRPTTGDVLPDVALPGVEGGVIRTGEFRGRPLLIFMWASW
jgi:hypothetical protein